MVISVTKEIYSRERGWRGMGVGGAAANADPSGLNELKGPHGAGKARLQEGTAGEKPLRLGARGSE